MNLLQALLQTYNAAEAAGLVDVWKESEPMLLPLYHSSRQSRGEDIVPSAAFHRAQQYLLVFFFIPILCHIRPIGPLKMKFHGIGHVF